jgi:hypothetical protein
MKNALNNFRKEGLKESLVMGGFSLIGIMAGKLIQSIVKSAAAKRDADNEDNYDSEETEIEE